MNEADWFRDGGWEGETCYIIGGGPSVSLVDLSLLDGRVIAINRALEIYPDADLWVFMDKNIWNWAVWTSELPELSAAADSYLGLKVTRYVDGEDDLYRDTDVIRMPYVQRADLAQSLDQDPFPIGGNSGFFAINLAYCLGADPIILLGFDCHIQEPMEENAFKERLRKEGWWHDGYPETEPSPSTHIKHAEQFARLAEQADRTILNASPLTKLDCWPVVELEECVTRS